MFKSVYLSAALILGLARCSGSSSKLEDTVLHHDMNRDGKEDIVRLRRSEGLECDKGYDDSRKSPPGIYVLLRLGNSFRRGDPVYNLCEITVCDLSTLAQVDPRLGRIEITDYKNDGRLDIIHTPSIREMYTMAYSDRFGDSMHWEATIVKP